MFVFTGLDVGTIEIYLFLSLWTVHFNTAMVHDLGLFERKMNTLVVHFCVYLNFVAWHR